MPRRGRREVHARAAAMREVVDPHAVARESNGRHFAAKQHHGNLRIAEKRKDFAIQPTVANPREEHAGDSRFNAQLGVRTQLRSGLKRRIRP